MNPNEAEFRTGATTLESWKEIAAYLQRNAVTVRRWEKEEGLPVHRHSHKKGSSVYAYPREIDAWRESRKALPEPPPPQSLWKSLLAPPRRLAFSVTMALCLVMVGNGLRPQAAEAATPTLKVLCEESCVDLSDGGVSRDGRFLIGTDWGKGDLVMQDLRSGKRRYLGVRAATDSPKAWPEFATLSRDDRQIAYLWSSGEQMELRVIENKSGAKPRTILKGFFDLNGLDWAQDGKRILAMLEEKEGEDKLAWVAVSDGSVQTLKVFGKRLKQYPKVSPDGRFVAYSATPAELAGSKDQRIYVLTADGRTETEVVHAAGVNRNPVWSADGSHLIFMSDRTGKNSLWSVRVAEGKPTGTEKLLKADVSNSLGGWGVTRDGSYIFQTTTTPVISTSIVAMEPGGNKIAGTSPQVVDTFVGTFPVWSPDGKQMAFTRARPDGSDANLVVRTLDTGNERIYSQDGIRTAPARWFPDGKSLIKNGALPGADSGALYRLNLGTGEYATIAKFGNSLGGGESEVSADGKTAYLAGRDPATGNLGRLMAVDIATGTSRTIFTSPVGGNLQRFALSPAGDQFLLRIEVADNKNSTSYLATVGVNGNGYREFYRTGTQITGIAWTSDAKGALFAARPESQWQVLRVPIAGGQPEPTGLVVESADSRVLLSLNRDGTRLAASSRKLVWEIWELEHLTSALK